MPNGVSKNTFPSRNCRSFCTLNRDSAPACVFGYAAPHRWRGIYICEATCYMHEKRLSTDIGHVRRG